MRFGAVEKLLHQAVRTELLTLDFDPFIQVLAKTDEMNRAVVAGVRDGIRLLVEDERLSLVERAVTQDLP